MGANESGIARRSFTIEVARDGETSAIPGHRRRGGTGSGSAVLVLIDREGLFIESLVIRIPGEITMPQKKKQSLVITTSGKRSIHEVAKDLKNEGFDVEQVLDSINVVTGKGDAGSTHKLRAVQDVVDVSEDNPVDIGPPGSEPS